MTSTAKVIKKAEGAIMGKEANLIEKVSEQWMSLTAHHCS